jgi:serine/threonine protein kinase
LQKKVKESGSVKQDRKTFSTNKLLEEANAFFALRKYQGTYLPRCFGAYVMRFPERELQQDRNVGVLLVESIDGHLLSELPRYEFAEFEARRLVESILKAIKVINDSGIFLPTALDERIVVDYIGRKIKVVDFLYQMDRSGCDVARQMSAVRTWLDECGYTGLIE